MQKGAGCVQVARLSRSPSSAASSRSRSARRFLDRFWPLFPQLRRMTRSQPVPLIFRKRLPEMWLARRPGVGGAVLSLGMTLGSGCSTTAEESPPASAGSAGSTSVSGMGGTTTASGGGGAAAGAPSAGGGARGGALNTGGVASTEGGAGASGNGGGAATSGGSGGGGGGAGEPSSRSSGCGQVRTLQDGNHTFASAGAQRSYALRAPANYDKEHPYRLILGFHGATGKSSDIAPSYFGLWELSEGSTIFAAPDAVGGLWKADPDTLMVKDLLEQLKKDLCIDTSRIELEGFSQGGAMTWTLACALPGVFQLAIVHSGGGLPMPQTCEPIPFLSSLGHDGSGQGMSSDFFASKNGCSVESLPMAPAGGHACTDYKGCSAGHPTRWCAYDGGHTSAPTDSGQSKSWMPGEVWSFVKTFG